MLSNKKIIKAASVLVILFVAFGPLGVLQQTPTVHAQTNPYAGATTASPESATGIGGGPITAVGQQGKWSSIDCDGIANCLANIVYYIGPGFASWIASTVATFFDYIVAMSLNSSAYALDFLTTSWTLVLSLANMFFIFILIYTAFVIMLKAETARTMQILAWVIAIALVVNFSFFFTRIVIDAGNILGTQFYNAIVLQNNGSTGISISGASGTANAPSDITANLMSAIGVEQLLGTNSFNLVQQVTGSSSWGTLLVITVIYLSVAIMFWIIAAALLMAGIKFFLRIVGLWFVLIASPLAFVSQTLNKTKNFFDMWLRALISLAFYPAVFLFMFYVLNLFVQNLSSGNLINAIFTSNGTTNSAANAASNPYPLVVAIANVSIRVGFIIVMLYIMLKVADWVMEQAGGMATTLMNKGSAALISGGFRSASTIGAFAGRNTAGRIAFQAAQSSGFKNWAGRSAIGNALWRGTEKASKSTYDARNAPGGSLLKKAISTAGIDITTGTASKRNFDKIVSDKAKRDEEVGKSLKASDGEAILNQKKFIEEYDEKNGAGAYSRRVEDLAKRSGEARTKREEWERAAQRVPAGQSSAFETAQAKLHGTEEKKLQAELKPILETGKKRAETEAKTRVNQFADRLQTSSKWGHALGAVKVRKLVTEKSTADKFKELAKEAVKEEEGGDDHPTGGGAAGGGGGAGTGGGGHGPAAAGGGGGGTHASSSSAPSADAHEQTKLLQKIERDVRKTNEQNKESFSHLGAALHTTPTAATVDTKKLEKHIDAKIEGIAENRVAPTSQAPRITPPPHANDNTPKPIQENKPTEGKEAA